MKNKDKKDNKMDILDILLMIFGISLLIFVFRKYVLGSGGTNQSGVIISGSGSGGGSSAGGSSGGGSGGTTNGIAVINQSLGDIYTGTNNVSISLNSPTITGSCSDTKNRKVVGITSGIILIKNGNMLSVNDTFTDTDILTLNVSSSLLPNTTQQEIIHQNYVLFTYKAVGACGDGNVAEIKANIKVAGVSQTLKSFAFQDGYTSNGGYTKYASTADATDKNFEESGFINRNGTIYATDMVNGAKAYSNAQGTELYPAGVYFYGTDFTTITILADGTMTFSSDIQKPSSLTGIIINDGFN